MFGCYKQFAPPPKALKVIAAPGETSAAILG